MGLPAGGGTTPERAPIRRLRRRQPAAKSGSRACTTRPARTTRTSTGEPGTGEPRCRALHRSVYEEVPAHREPAPLRSDSQRRPLGPRDPAFWAPTFLTVDFLALDFFIAEAFAGGFLAVDFLATVPSDLIRFPARAGSILAAPAPGANKVSCPSFHRTRNCTRRSPSITSMISPSRAGPPTRCGFTTMRSPFLATRSPFCLADLFEG